MIGFGICIDEASCTCLLSNQHTIQKQELKLPSPLIRALQGPCRALSSLSLQLPYQSTPVSFVQILCPLSSISKFILSEFHSFSAQKGHMAQPHILTQLRQALIFPIWNLYFPQFNSKIKVDDFFLNRQNFGHERDNRQGKSN